MALGIRKRRLSASREQLVARPAAGSTVAQSSTQSMTLLLQAAQNLLDAGRTADANAIYMQVIETGSHDEKVMAKAMLASSLFDMGESLRARRLLGEATRECREIKDPDLKIAAGLLIAVTTVAHEKN